MSSPALVLLLASPTRPPVEAAVEPAAAMIEMRVFEARTAPGAEPSLRAEYLAEADTFELDMQLMRLESAGEEGEVAGIPGLSHVRVLSAPRVISSEGEEARIESGADLEGDKPPLLAADVRWAWEPGARAGEPNARAEGSSVPTGSADRARLELRLEVSGETWTAVMLLAPGESWLMSSSRDGVIRAAVFTFKPLVAD